MRHVALCLILFCAPAVVAQEKPPADNRPQQSAEAQEYSRATPAPQLGHPLDPADVDVLTGKTKAATSPGYRFDPLSYAYGSYASYPTNTVPWREARLAGLGATREPFGPLLFGRTRNGSFFLFGRPPFFVPPFFFFRSRPFLFGPGRSSFFLLR